MTEYMFLLRVVTGGDCEVIRPENLEAITVAGVNYWLLPKALLPESAFSADHQQTESQIRTAASEAPETPEPEDWLEVVEVPQAAGEVVVDSWAPVLPHQEVFPSTEEASAPRRRRGRPRLETASPQPRVSSEVSEAVRAKMVQMLLDAYPEPVSAKSVTATVAPLYGNRRQIPTGPQWAVLQRQGLAQKVDVDLWRAGERALAE